MHGRCSAVVVALFLIGCAVDRPSAPAVRLVVDRDLPGIDVWSPLGFDVEIVPAWPTDGAPECARQWYAAHDTACAITINASIEPNVLGRTGSRAASSRDDRWIAIDAAIEPARMTNAVAHELGHILLDADQHTVGGVMGGSSDVMLTVDYELACSSIAICVTP